MDTRVLLLYMLLLERSIAVEIDSLNLYLHHMHRIIAAEQNENVADLDRKVAVLVLGELLANA